MLLLTCHPGYENGHDHRGLVDHSLGRGLVGTPCEENNHHDFFEEKESVHLYEEIDVSPEHAHALGQNRIAKRLMGEYEPTKRCKQISSQHSYQASYFDFQKVVVPDTLVVHLMISVIGVSTTLILNKGEPASSVNEIRAEHIVNRDSCVLTDGSLRFVAQVCHNEQDGHS
jgi:hypothetical protein